MALPFLDTLDAFLVHSPAQARDLIQQHSLEPHSLSLPPELFWVIVDRDKWRPWVICVKRGESVLGLVYLRERIVAGIPSGLVHGDSSMRSMIYSNVQDRELIFSTALRFIFSHRRIFGASIYIPPEELEPRTFAALAERTNLAVAYSAPPARHSRLLLPQSYESFLQSLGPHTRRNLRYYRRRSIAAGHCYIGNLSREDFRSISLELLGKSRISTTSKAVQRSIDILESVKDRIICGLRGKDGRWLSLIAGWREDDRVTIFSQMNSDLDRPNDSLSVVLRGYLLESLIESGAHTVDFWWGVKGPLERYASKFPVVNVHLQSETLHWRILWGLLVKFNAHYPAKLPKSLKFIVPPMTTSMVAQKYSSVSSHSD